MEDVLELLQAAAEPTAYADELPSEDDLLDIQEQLLIHIPYDLRQYLLLASNLVVGQLEPVTASDPHLHTYLPEVAANLWQLGLPRYLLPLCLDGDDCYAITPDGGVVLWCCANCQLMDDSWETLWDWAYECWLGNA